MIFFPGKKGKNALSARPHGQKAVKYASLLFQAFQDARKHGR